MDIFKIEESWKKYLKTEFEKEYFKKLCSKVESEYELYEVYPKFKDIFLAFNLCPFDHVKVVILGQDPYHSKGQATGLSFAVEEGVRIPPSLRNIFKEIKNDLKTHSPSSTNLKQWAEQGVLLLNSILTVRSGQPASHKNIGWERFTDTVIDTLNLNKKNLVYLLWGNYAKKKCKALDKENNLVLESPHPSPLSAGKFFGNNHFSKCNQYLIKKKLAPIKW